MEHEAGERYATGVVHGRFQVLHNDHYRYLCEALRRCARLVVGITNPDPWVTRDEESDPQRSNPLNNPLTYYERYQLARAALGQAGVAPEDQVVVPLPINLPDLYRHYVPLDAVFFLSIYDDWGRRKLDYFQTLGLKTHVLWEVEPDQKGISGTDVRSRMAKGWQWEHLVPSSVAALLREWNVPTRLRNMEEGARWPYDG